MIALGIGYIAVVEKSVEDGHHKMQKKSIKNIFNRKGRRIRMETDKALEIMKKLINEIYNEGFKDGMKSCDSNEKLEKAIKEGIEVNQLS